MTVWRSLLHFHTEYKIKTLPRVHMPLFNTLSYHNTLISHRVIILEDDLEKLMVAKETEEMTCAGYQDLRERLQLLQPHMQASTCCWDDTLAQVDRMLRRVSSPPGQKSSSQPINQSTINQSSSAVALLLWNLNELLFC